MEENSEDVFCNRTIYEPPRDWIAYLINLYVIPTVSGLGSLAALICIFVFSKKQMRSSLNVYLGALSLFDFVLLIMSLIIYPPMQLCVEEGRGDTPMCHFFWRSTLFTYPISVIAQTASVFTCVAVTFDRFFAVCFPLKSKIWCTPKSARNVLIGIISGTFFIKFPAVLELTLSECGELTATELRKNDIYITLYITYGYTFIMVLVPWGIMIVLNVFVVLAVHKAYKLRQTLQGKKNHEERDRRCSLMAVAMISTFIAFNCLAAINNIVEAFAFDINPAIARFLIPCSNLLVCINSASNIVIYCLFGARFRQMCVIMLCGRSSKWMIWLKAGKQIVSDFDIRDGVTRGTSVDGSSTLLSTRNSHRWSSRGSNRGPHRKTTLVANKEPQPRQHRQNSIQLTSSQML